MCGSTCWKLHAKWWLLDEQGRETDKAEVLAQFVSLLQDADTIVWKHLVQASVEILKTPLGMAVKTAKNQS